MPTQAAWADVPLVTGAAILLKAAASLDFRFDELAIAELPRETGGIIAKGQRAVREAVALCRLAAAAADAGRKARCCRARRGACVQRAGFRTASVVVISPFDLPRPFEPALRGSRRWRWAMPVVLETGRARTGQRRLHSREGV